jgi:hypothetical protein
MSPAAKRVLRAATRSEAYWKLCDGEKLVWMIDRAYQIGCRDRLAEKEGRRCRHRPALKSMNVLP